MRAKLGSLEGLVVDTCHAGLGLDEDFSCVGHALAHYALTVVDEFSQLNGDHFNHIDALRRATDFVSCFVLSGDRHQLAGYGEERPWHVPRWKKATERIELFELYRCKDPAFKKVLGCLRIHKPPMHSMGRDIVSVASIMQGRNAWKGHWPTVQDISRILTNHPKTTMLAVTRRGAFELDGLCTEALYAYRRGQIKLKSAIFSQILGRSSWETSRRGQINVKSAIFRQILARSSRETYRRGEINLKSAIFDQILARSSREISRGRQIKLNL